MSPWPLRNRYGPAATVVPSGRAGAEAREVDVARQGRAVGPRQGRDRVASQRGGQREGDLISRGVHLQEEARLGGQVQPLGFRRAALTGGEADVDLGGDPGGADLEEPGGVELEDRVAGGADEQDAVDVGVELEPLRGAGAVGLAQEHVEVPLDLEPRGPALGEAGGPVDPDAGGLRVERERRWGRLAWDVQGLRNRVPGRVDLHQREAVDGQAVVLERREELARLGHGAPYMSRGTPLGLRSRVSLPAMSRRLPRGLRLSWPETSSVSVVMSVFGSSAAVRLADPRTCTPSSLPPTVTPRSTSPVIRIVSEPNGAVADGAGAG